MLARACPGPATSVIVLMGHFEPAVEWLRSDSECSHLLPDNLGVFAYNRKKVPGSCRQSDFDRDSDFYQSRTQISVW
jgi:hypothetical protein